MKLRQKNTYLIKNGYLRTYPWASIKDAQASSPQKRTSRIDKQDPILAVLDPDLDPADQDQRRSGSESPRWK